MRTHIPFEALDPLTMPVQGLQLIEASAGTGKSWTLAALYLRIVLENGLNPPQILVMTFTEAATAELRGAIRERLAKAASYFQRSSAIDTGAGVDDFLCALRARYPQEQWAECAQRLVTAAQWMDEAAIFTIHGWSSRMLRQHAFDSASLFNQDRVEDSEALKLAAARDYWRRWFYPLSADQLAGVEKLASSPEALLKLLDRHWRLADRGPGAVPYSGPAPDALLARWQVWNVELQRAEAQARALWSDHRVALHAQLIAAMNEDLNGNSYRAASREAYLAQLDAWSAGEAERDDDNLKRFGKASLVAKVKKGRKPPVDHFGVFSAIDVVCDLLEAEPEVTEAIETHAAGEIGQSYQRRKSELAQFDFSDLLQRLYYALQADDGRLATAIRTQYPVALVDEFQDTDPWQYGSLSRVYGAKDGTALVMIGDPKQAIYGFRGADLATYMRARADADAICTLDGNFRSTKGVVAAVNHVFGSALRPFADVPFMPVEARNLTVRPVIIEGNECPAMTVLHLAEEGTLSKPVYQSRMADIFATQMVALLNVGAAQPRDMAVLVRGWDEARAIRRALNARGVRSVYLSERDSVFATSEAQDLWRVLRAVAQPRATGLLRAALVTRLWGKPWTELDALFADEDAWESIVEHFHRWQQIWVRQGFLPMLHQMLHDQSIPSRLLALDDGERRLTNVLHLGDLLQGASLALQGEHALIRYLEDQLQQVADASGSGRNDAAQLRLESDAHLVQVVTMHKSKGLQYPLVFLPFVSNFREENAQSDRPDGERLAEDIRLIYVALTRAERAVWLGVANRSRDFSAKAVTGKSALSHLLGRCSNDDLQERLSHWSACPHIDVRQAPETSNARYVPKAKPGTLRDAAVSSRRLRSHWWVASFSALTRDLSATGSVLLPANTERDEKLEDAQRDSGTDALRTSNEARAADASAGAEALKYNQFPAGSAYGTLLHDLLEWQALRGWPAVRGNATHEAEWQRMLVRLCERLELDSLSQRQLDNWIKRILGAALPLARDSVPVVATLTLADLKRQTAWPEMAFSFPVHRLGTQALDALVQLHVYPDERRIALESRVLSGMLTGLMDLVFEHDGRYYVLDYKSNKLDGYASEQLRASILGHRYDVQYTLYLLALHRLLKARLPGYDYDTHVGGALYLFLRGIDEPGAGVHLHKPSRNLIEQLDAAFAHQPDVEGEVA